MLVLFFTLIPMVLSLAPVLAVGDTADAVVDAIADAIANTHFWRYCCWCWCCWHLLMPLLLLVPGAAEASAVDTDAADASHAEC